MSDYEKALRDMYDLGVEHGRELEKKEMEIERLKAEVEALAEINLGSKVMSVNN